MQLATFAVALLTGPVESAIREMSKWNREGVLVTGEGRFVIPDREKLKTAANVGDEG